MKANTIDVVERLRAYRPYSIKEGEWFGPKVCAEAADTIERLCAELAAKVPEGYVVIPREPNHAIAEPLWLAGIDIDSVRDAYTAMIAAAEGGE